MSTDSQDRGRQAADLAAQATAKIQQGDVKSAKDLLQEASSLASGNPEVARALHLLQLQDDGDSLIRLCRNWLPGNKDDAGEEILDYLHKHQLSERAAGEAMTELLDYSGDEDMADHITAEMLAHLGARKTLARAIIKQPTATYDNIYERGDDSMDILTDMLFEDASWPSEKDRVAAERDAFQLALAQMMLAGQDHPERAMKCISRLLAAENKNLGGLIDADGFDVILSQLDIRLPQILRTHATVATAKLLELSQDTSQQLVSQFVVKKFERPTADGLVIAFSAAASVFPMAPQSATQLFLDPGFLNRFEPLVLKYNSPRVEQSALELLSAACIDRTCRDAIRKYMMRWLTGVSNRKEESDDKKRSSQAALVLVKVQQQEDVDPMKGEQKSDASPTRDPKAQANLVSRFTALIINSTKRGSKAEGVKEAVEGLAYASIEPAIKDVLARDTSFLKALVETTTTGLQQAGLLFGTLTIVTNLTNYLPLLTEEQKKISQLKTFANSQKPKGRDPLDEDPAVATRNTAVLKANIIPLLVSSYKTTTPGLKLLTTQCLDNLSREKPHRGTMAQQGAVKLLLQLFDTFTTTQPPTDSSQIGKHKSAHSLARILISVNPHHVFGSSGLPITSAIRPLSSLLSPSDDDNSSSSATGQPSTLLPVFESLLALTNLASTADSARDTILRLSFPAIQSLLLHNNPLLQRAACELTCNLCASPACAAKFADGSKPATNNLYILLALADVDDLATRSAAAGALAMLTEWDSAVGAVLEKEGGRGVEVLVGLCADEDEGLVHRGVVCLRNLVFCGDEGLAGKARGMLKGEGEVGVERELDAVGVLRVMVTKTRNREIMQIAVEVLQTLR